MLRFSQEQTQKAAKILARGFIDDPTFSFILPQSETRLEALTAFFQLFVADGIKRGEVVFAPEEQGVSVWYPTEVAVYDDQFEETFAKVVSIASHFGGLEAGERFEQIGKKVEASEPVAPHCEVLWIALVPEARGKGIGGSLLQPVINYSNAKKVGCYLVSSNPRNISFYEKHGFRRVSPIQINDTHFMTGMWREPAEN
ncbi:GNAT family N-acetyltransferase [Mastigocladopsis repens]|uniref:GNAT family N-acetyltransferase n=1 Tax=Mastigocladopsis repens TaxID=221287 RepID=UPI0002F9EBCD|nr:GNAT family N-acetyltransferase [Mastigocladopsis repens]